MSFKRNIGAVVLGASLLMIRGHERVAPPPAPDPHAVLAPLNSADDAKARDAFFNELSALVDKAKDQAMDNKGTLIFLATLNRLGTDIDARSGQEAFRLTNTKSGTVIMDLTADFAQLADTYRKLPEGAVPPNNTLSEFMQRKVQQAAGPDMYDMIPKQAINNVVGEVVYSLDSSRGKPVLVAGGGPTTQPAAGEHKEGLAGKMADWVQKLAETTAKQREADGQGRKK